MPGVYYLGWRPNRQNLARHVRDSSVNFTTINKTQVNYEYDIPIMCESFHYLDCRNNCVKGTNFGQITGVCKDILEKNKIE